MKQLNLFILAMSFFAFACGESEMPTPDSGIVLGAECVDLTGCGAGKQNAREVSFCENCFSRPDTHVCEAGTCRPLDANSQIKYDLGIPPSARGALSWTQASLNPVRADGVTVNCAGLLASTDYQNNHIYNAGNSNFKVFATGGGADPALVYRSSIAADIGSNRILVVRVVSETQGKGQVLAHGCVENIEVKAGEDTSVILPLEAL